MFKTKWVVDFVMNQKSLEQFRYTEGTSYDDEEFNEDIRRLNKAFPRVAKYRRFVVKVYKEYLFGLLRSETECYYVEAYSQRAAINKVLRGLQ